RRSDSENPQRNPGSLMLSREIIRKVRRIQIRTRHLVGDVFAGRYQSAFRGQGIEFHEAREYVPGDDVRSIDWNVTARMGRPFIKRFVEEREMTVILAADVSASNRFGSRAQIKKDLIAEMSAVLAFSAVRSNDRVGLLLFSDEVECYLPPRKGTTHVLRVIREALQFEMQGRGTRVAAAIDYLNRVLHRRAVCFLLSDFQDAGEFDRPLAALARRHDVIAVIIGDRHEQVWPKAGLVWWQDLESGQRVLLDTSHPAARARLSSLEARRREALRTRFRRFGMDTIEVHTGEPYERALARFFEEREKRRRTA
ncbi:MAG: DUF58 domain-containing protein, partial [Kiritimatiellia bacterium]|nr:DUF58 domain-containing protein [Kiritimatiellia bacterium]